AARFLQEATEQRVLMRDEKPSIYAYTQIFPDPAGKSGEKLERRGFIALAKLAEYSEQIVYRHEQTLSKPKSDRLNLLRATKTQSGQLFMLYHDPEGEVDKTIAEHIASVQPDSELTDEYGVQHRMWKISDPTVI